MSPETSEWWDLATHAFEAAKANVAIDTNTAVNRAYYAAFYALTALFTEEERHFRKHSQLRSAVHRDLVNAGRWRESIGKDFDDLQDLRTNADYAGVRMTPDEAIRAVALADRILAEVRELRPQDFGQAPGSPAAG